MYVIVIVNMIDWLYLNHSLIKMDLDRASFLLLKFIEYKLINLI